MKRTTCRVSHPPLLQHKLGCITTFQVSYPRNVFVPHKHLLIAHKHALIATEKMCSAEGIIYAAEAQILISLRNEPRCPCPILSAFMLVSFHLSSKRGGQRRKNSQEETTRTPRSWLPHNNNFNKVTNTTENITKLYHILRCRDLAEDFNKWQALPVSVTACTRHWRGVLHPPPKMLMALNVMSVYSSCTV